MIELYLAWKPKFVSWIILSPTLEPIKGVYAWSTSKAKSSQDACLPGVRSSHFKQIPKDHNQGSSLPSASPSHFKQITKDHNQSSSPPSLKHPQWTKKKHFAQLCLTPHLVCNIKVKVKVCLFIPCFYISLNSKNLCSIWCTLFMYIYIYIYIFFFKSKKKFQDFQIFTNKRVSFSKWYMRIPWTKHFLNLDV